MYGPLTMSNGYDIIFSNHRIVGDGGLLSFRDAADGVQTDIFLRSIYLNGYIEFNQNAYYIYAQGIDNSYMYFGARDTGVATVEVARLQGAADPYFQATLALRLNPIAQPAAPVKGMLLYNSATDKLNMWNGAAWEVIAST